MLSDRLVLLDLATWPRPPADESIMAMIDEDLADAVAADPPEVADGVPAGGGPTPARAPRADVEPRVDHNEDGG